MTDEALRPAWSQNFTPEAIEHLVAEGPFGKITPEWAWGESKGKGVRVAVVDSGIEHDHPAVGKSVKGGVIVEYELASQGLLSHPAGRPAHRCFRAWDCLRGHHPCHCSGG